ncbi:hypothetical protein HPP92_019435 [Vanilla planifolia]|uniref:Uncharacterized protein n=1 Tax=Vanilla planifolia TaxID=51239 RepID=A0A835Q6X7_VANPL|nr:hypothetical protein HPP92_019435 [Vanilla planifolia]
MGQDENVLHLHSVGLQDLSSMCTFRLLLLAKTCLASTSYVGRSKQSFPRTLYPLAFKAKLLWGDPYFDTHLVCYDVFESFTIAIGHEKVLEQNLSLTIG